MKDYSFGNYICALRTGRGLSQFQLGTLVGVTDKAVSKWENGGSRPRLSTCYRLAEVLGVSLSELLSCKEYVTSKARKELNMKKKNLWKEAYARLSMYGEDIPALCWSRLAAEEQALSKNDIILVFGALAEIRKAAEAEKTSYLIRGDINSSYAAWLLGATEVNPLPPHYVCPVCGKTEFVPDIADGFDLPPKKCSCGADFDRDGHDIPYERFAKVQRKGIWVEMNVPKGFIPKAVEVLERFYGVKPEPQPLSYKAREGCTVKTYAVHPDPDLKPALTANGLWDIDSAEYRQWRENEILFTFTSGPSLDRGQTLRESSDRELPKPRDYLAAEKFERVYRVLKAVCPPVILMGDNQPDDTEQFCLHREEIFHRALEVLEEKEPHDFDFLIRLEGIRRGTGLWDENGEQLMERDDVSFRSIPATREDVWKDVSKALADSGIRDNGLALQVMDKATMGSYSQHGMPQEVEKLLLSIGLPQWYPDYLKKVAYMWPKGHIIAVMIDELKIKYFLD